VAEVRRSDAAALAALLDELGKHSELGPHRKVVTELAQRLAAPDGQRSRDAKAADGWADLDLIAALGGPVPVAARPMVSVAVPVAGRAKQAWWRTAIDALPPVLVFVPILLTWLSLFAASNAYRSLEASPSARAASTGKSFLELWQQGFAGRLPAFLSFGYVAMYTVAAVSVLIVATAVGGHFHRRDEEQAEQEQERAAAAAERARQAVEQSRAVADRDRADAERARADMLPALARAQAELNNRRLGTPVRFAAELSQAATELRQLLEHTDHTQDSALKLAKQNQALSEKLGKYAVEMRGITGELQSAAELMRAAASTLANANAVLGSEVVGRVEQSTGRLDQVTGDAAARVGDLVQTGQASLDGITERFDAVMAGIREQVDATTTAMIDAGEKYAAAIGDSSGRAAATIGATYQEAVAQAAVGLATSMTQTTNELSAIVTVVGRSANTQLAAAMRTEEAVTAHAEAVTTAADRISGAADDIAGAAQNVSGAAKTMTGAAESISGAAGHISGTAHSMSGVAAGVSDSSGALERAVTGYTSAQQQVADALGRAADNLSEHAASLAERLATANGAPADDRATSSAQADDAEAANAAAEDDLFTGTGEPDHEAPYAEEPSGFGAPENLAFPDTAAPDPRADLTGAEEFP
jgi:hypothetical protein